MSSDPAGVVWPDGLAPLVRWLQQPAVAARVRDTVPMPLQARRGGSKAPAFPHKDSAAWSLDKARDFAARNRQHANWSLLLDGLLAVDADDAVAVAWLEGLATSSRVPELRDCPVQLTRKGRHYLFARPAWADAEGYWDGARQAPSVDATTGQPFNVDLKTRCATGTRGVLSVAPSSHKSWLAGRAPWEPGVVLHDAPRALLALVATPKGGKATPSSALVVATPARTPPGPSSVASSNSVVVAGLAAARRDPPSELEVARAEMDVFKACDLAASLSPSRAHDERTWMQVGWALHNVAAGAAPTVPGADARLLAAWDAFSKTSAKYKSGECAERWAKMDVRDATQARLTLGSLVRWSREDAGGYAAPDSFSEASSPALTFTATRDASSERCDRSLDDRRARQTTHVISRLRGMVLAHARDQRLRKLGDRFWNPVPGSPCAYVEGDTFRDVLNALLEDEPDYFLSSRQDELVKYLRNYNPPQCRNLVRDRDLVSFANGVLLLREARFVPIDPVSPPDELPRELKGRVARNHIPREFTGSVETPSMDRILLAQMTPAVADTLWVLLGRLLFKVGELDNWQIMPLLVGAGGTGKSIVLTGASAMFARSAVGTIANNHEQVFGLESKLECEVVFGRDMPKKMSLVLPQELLQLMITGEPVCIPRKGQCAVEVTWSAPLIMASNFYFDYSNASNQISRRFAVFRFQKPVKLEDQDPVHGARVQSDELPAIMYRALVSYLAAVQQHGGASFWSWCPEELRRAQHFMASSMSALRRFLSLSADDDASEYPVKEDGTYVALKTLVAAYNRFVEQCRQDGVQVAREAMDESSLLAAGFAVEEKVHICNACGHKVLRPRRCCSAYSADGRTKLKAVAGLRLHSSDAAALL